MKMEIIVALIAAGATVLTIIGSIVAVKVTSNSQIKEQKIIADREMKRKYYNAFIEAFTQKLFYINKPDCMEKIEAEMTFVLEANRLPLYASEEMIQFIERIKNSTIAKETKMEEFLVILRKDLCENSFDNFSDIKKITLVMPNRVIYTDLNGRKISFSKIVLKYNGRQLPVYKDHIPKKDRLHFCVGGSLIF